MRMFGIFEKNWLQSERQDPPTEFSHRRKATNLVRPHKEDIERQMPYESTIIHKPYHKMMNSISYSLIHVSSNKLPVIAEY